MRNFINTLSVLLLLCSTCIVRAQGPVMIYGEVKTVDGQPLQGAAIAAKHQNQKPVTDEKGRFKMLIFGTDTIIVTHVAFKPVTAVVDSKLSSILRISMEPIVTELKQVLVSNGYQDIPKERATGSFYKLDNQLLSQRVGTDIISRIEGLTSGLQIDRRNPEQQTIQIRGLSTLNVDNAAPLIVLDNFPYSGDINNINPNDIESVTVLKDAAASSIWGARAGNGVIVINTKRARANQPLQVAFNANITVRPKPDLFSADQLSVGSYIDLEKFLFGKGYYDSRFNDPSFPATSEVVDLLYQARKGIISNTQADQRIAGLRSKDVRNDIQRYLYRNAVNQQYHLNLTGAGANIRYLLSAGYDKELNALRGNDNDRLTLRSNNLIDLTKKWQLSTDVILTRTNSVTNSPGGFGSIKYSQTSISPYGTLVNPDGSPAAVDLKYSKAFTDTAGKGRLLDWKYRPLQELSNNDNRSGKTDILLNAGMTYKIWNALKTDVKYQYQRSWSSSENLDNLNSFSTRDLINTFTQLNGSTVFYAIPKKGILYSNDGNNKQHAVRAQLSFEHLWDTGHRLTAIAGTEIRETRSDSFTGITYGFDPDNLTTMPVDYVNLYPTYAGIGGSRYINYGTQFKAFLNRFVSYFANAAYTWKDKYTFTASARRDESNLFGVSTNQKGVPLWSVGGLWKADRENFYKISWLPELGLRMTYGVSGNLSPNESALTRIQSLPVSLNPLRIPFYDITAPPNPNLRWEQVKAFNVGIDLGAFDNRLRASVEYYTKHSEDLINSVLLDPTVGFGSSSQNSASIFARGIDVVINSLNLNGRLKWKSTLLFSQVSFKTTKNLNPPGELGLVSSGGSIFPVLNQNPYVIVTYKWAGLDPRTGDPQGYLNGTVSKDYAGMAKNPLDQQVVSGSALPTVFGTLRNTLEWRRLSVAFNLSYRLRYYFLKPTTNYTSLIGFGAGFPDYDQRWQNPGDEQRTNVPSFIYPGVSSRDNFYTYSSVNVEKADNIKLDEIFLSYDIRPVRPVLGIRSLQVYLFANQLNVLLWKANKAGLDPDYLYNFRPPAAFSAGVKFTL